MIILPFNKLKSKLYPKKEKIIIVKIQEKKPLKKVIKNGLIHLITIK